MDTTDNIIEKMQQDTPENVVFHVMACRYLLSTAAVKSVVWGLIPDMIKDEKSEDAKKHSLVRIGIKRLVAPFLPEILKRTWDSEVEIKRGLNVLDWLPLYLTHFAVGLLASKEWRIRVENHQDCGGAFRIIGISPDADDIISPSAIASPASDL